jgi:hypothetical protein
MPDSLRQWNFEGLKVISSGAVRSLNACIKRTFNNGTILALIHVHSGTYAHGQGTEATPSVDDYQRDCSKQVISNANSACLVSFEVADWP